MRVLLVAVGLASTGCAVGNFITGAPSQRPRSPELALLARRCSGCHVTPEPADWSPQEWRAAVERMKRRMRLPETEWASIAAMRGEGGTR